MTGGDSRSMRAREQRRNQLLAKRRQARTRVRLRRGQTLIIFALSFTVLLGMAGLAIDVARAYDLYARMQRAAEAGVVAGVLYMPTNYNTARIPGDGLSAVSRASAEVVKNGFGTALPVNDPQSSACPATVSSVEVAVCPLATKPSNLRVTITERLNVVFLSGLGIQPITLQASAQAEYLPPVAIASRQNYFGDQMECTSGSGTTACDPTDNTQTHLQYFMATMNGPADLKESGDPYVYCEEGNAQPAPSDPQFVNGLDPTSSSNTYNGYGTNHPQYPGVPTGTTYTGGINQYCGQPVPGSKHGNPDYQPAGYDGPMTAGQPLDGGYNYAVNVSPSITSATLWIFNPYYIPNGTGNTIDHFQDTGSTNYYQGPMGEGIGNRFDNQHRDAPLFFFNTTFTLYKVSNLFDRTTDGSPVWTQTYKPYDATGADLTQHGCASNTVYDPQYAGANTANTYHNPGSIQLNAPGECVAPPTCEPVYGSGIWSSWCEAMAPGGSPFSLQSGTEYRLVVEVTGIVANATDPADPRGYDYNSTLQDGYGQHAYALKLCNGSPATAVNCDNGTGGTSVTTNTNLTIAAWNNADVTFQQQLGNAPANPNNPQNSCVSGGITSKYACMDLACIPSAYAGRTLTASFFDPGDGSGDLYMGVVPPPGSSSNVNISYPSNVTSLSGGAYDGDTVVQGHRGSDGYRPFNGLWLNVTIQLGAAYQGDCTGATPSSPGWFQFVYMSTNGNPGDKLGVKFTLVGSPVHLVPVSIG